MARGRIGTVIAEKRKALRWSQKHLAAQAGCHLQTIVKIENGIIAFSRAFGAIERALGFEPGTLAPPPADAPPADTIQIRMNVMLKGKRDDVLERARQISALADPEIVAGPLVPFSGRGALFNVEVTPVLIEEKN